MPDLTQFFEALELEARYRTEMKPCAFDGTNPVQQQTMRRIWLRMRNPAWQKVGLEDA